MKLYSNVTILFCIWIGAILTIFYLGFSSLPHSGLFPNDFYKSLANWDGGHFLGIAEKGYSQKYQYAFFPLYPLTIRLLSQLTQNFLLAAILISIVSTFLGINLLYKLVVLDFDKKIAEKTVAAFLFFPTSFFLLTAYSEGLFFLLAVATFYFLRKNKLFWATVAASCASATRLVGLAVVAGLLIGVWTTQGISRKNWYILFAPLGFLIYCIFLYRQTGDPIYFITAENYWQRTLVVPGVGFWETLRQLINQGFTRINFNVLIDFFFAIFGVGFALRSFRFLPSSLASYSLFAIGIPFLSPTLSSMPRFLLPVFPIFILMALIKRPLIQFGLQTFSLMLLAIFAALFITGYWVS